MGPLVSGVVDYLTGRPLFVHLQHYVPDRAVSNTGAQQSTSQLQNFSDSATVGYISKGEEYRAVVGNFVTCCEKNHLQLNMAKTMELEKPEPSLLPERVEVLQHLLDNAGGALSCLLL